MKIAFITYEYPPDIGQGGIGTYVTQVSKLMADRGNEVYVFCGSPVRNNLEFINDVTIVRIKTEYPGDFQLNVLNRFDQYYKTVKFDIIESAEIGSNALKIKKAFPSIPMVVRLHAPNSLVESLKKAYVPFIFKLRYFLGALRRGKLDAGYWRKENFLKDPDRQFTLLAGRITAPSFAMKEWAVNNWNLPSNNISIIPNPFFPPRILLSATTGDERKSILFFGRLNVLKGLVALSYAARSVLKKHRDWKITFIGKDENSPSVKQTMKQWMVKVLKPVLPQVTFIDGLPYEELMQHIVQSDIVVLPSLFESFSYTCIEAMAAGKAVIGSKNGGMEELLDGMAGILVDPYKPHEIKKAIELLINDREARKNFGLRAKKRVLNYCDIDLIGKKLQDEYQQVINSAN